MMMMMMTMMMVMMMTTPSRHTPGICHGGGAGVVHATRADEDVRCAVAVEVAQWRHRGAQLVAHREAGSEPGTSGVEGRYLWVTDRLR
jgi:hypothetical protein